MEEKELACPSCGTDQFICVGVVGYQQRYDGTTVQPPLGRWDAMKPEWEIDYPLNVTCESCEADVTQLFIQRNILGVLYDDPKSRSPEKATLDGMVNDPALTETLTALLEAADRVVRQWETSDLQYAVRNLDAALAPFGMGTHRSIPE